MSTQLSLLLPHPAPVPNLADTIITTLIPWNSMTPQPLYTPATMINFHLLPLQPNSHLMLLISYTYQPNAAASASVPHTLPLLPPSSFMWPAPFALP
jgi:hypothetical protein